MKKSAVMLSVIVLGLIGITAILAGCSQGYTSGNSGTPAKSAATAPATQTTAAPTPTTTAASTGPSSKSSTLYPPKGFTPTVSGNTVTLSMDDVSQAGNGRFDINNMSFMAYQMDGKYYVRASVCVPCGSRIFSLKSGTLICGSCGTVFDATTGAGVRGVAACMTYGKKAVVYTTDGGNLVMTLGDLTTANQNTLNRKN